MLRAIAAAAALLVVSACDPFGLPSTRSLENGAVETLSAKNLEVKGAYTAAGSDWTVDLQMSRPDRAHLAVSNGIDSVEAIVIAGAAYFRGAQFLARHLTDPRQQSLAAAAGSSWWKGLAVALPRLPDLTDGPAFRSAFLGSAADRRTDHRSVAGVDAVELSGARADVFIASAPPYRLLRVVVRSGVSVDGITAATLDYTDPGAGLDIAPPAAVLDFGNASTLPPIYTVQSVDTSGCGSPCVVAATVKNIGGLAPATTPSTVAFTMSDPVSRQPIGTCSATVQPDVGYNATTSVSCAIAARPVNAAIVTAVATNPGRG